MRHLPPMNGNVNLAPHVVLLGAGASIAAYRDWGAIGNPLPSMQDLIDVLSLRQDIEQAGFSTNDLNFEAFYDELASSKGHEELRSLIEEKTYRYFSELKLPDAPTIYDYLVLGLREKDIIATFNWDPFLMQAYVRNEVVTRERRPRITFLHGNVMVGQCDNDLTAGINGRDCQRCGDPFAPSKLLYPVKHKDYSTNPFIKGEWGALRHRLGRGYFFTIFGYSAPKTDVEARSLLLDTWTKNSFLEQTEVEIIDVKPENELEPVWAEFFYSHHYRVINNVFSSYLFTHPRRSCDAFSSAMLMLEPWHDNPYPRFDSLEQLQMWVKPLIAEEEAYDAEGTPFSNMPLLPNEPFIYK